MKIRALLTAFLIGLAAPLLVVSPLLVTSGCTTPQKVVAFKTLKSVQNASVTGLELYGAACQRREVDAATQARVKDAYTKYQAVFALAIVAAQMGRKNGKRTSASIRPAATGHSASVSRA